MPDSEVEMRQGVPSAEMTEEDTLLAESSKTPERGSPLAFIGCFFGSVLGAGAAGCTVPLVVNAMSAANPFAACAAATAVAVTETTLGGGVGYKVGNSF